MLKKKTVTDKMKAASKETKPSKMAGLKALQEAKAMKDAKKKG